MTAKPVLLATCAFKSVEEASGYFREMAARYEDGEVVSCSGD